MMIRQRVDEVLRSQLGPGFSWTDASTLERDLTMDSLDLIQLWANVENEFRIELPDDLEWTRFRTVGDVKDWLEVHLETQRAVAF